MGRGEVGAVAGEWGWPQLRLLCDDCIPAEMALWGQEEPAQTWRPLSGESDGVWSISEQVLLGCCEAGDTLGGSGRVQRQDEGQFSPGGSSGGGDQGPDPSCPPRAQLWGCTDHGEVGLRDGRVKDDSMVSVHA